MQLMQKTWAPLQKLLEQTSLNNPSCRCSKGKSLWLRICKIFLLKGPNSLDHAKILASWYVEGRADESSSRRSFLLYFAACHNHRMYQGSRNWVISCCCCCCSCSSSSNNIQEITTSRSSSTHWRRHNPRVTCTTILHMRSRDHQLCDSRELWIVDDNDDDDDCDI